MQDFDQIWVYLSTSPLLHLTLTLLTYQIGNVIYRKAGMNPLLNPVLLAVLMLMGLLMLTDTPYAVYFDGAQFVHFLLGPATVALAIPLYRQFDKVRRSAIAIIVAILAGSTTAALTAMGISWALGGSLRTIISLAPKSVTTPVAMGITEQLGGLPSLTAVLVITTGILGAMLGPPLMNLLKISDPAARGLALGTASHGIGTARAMQVNPIAGAFAGLAMGLNALATAVLLPLVWRFFFD